MASDGKLIFDTELNDSGFKSGLSKLGGIAGKFASGTAKAIGAVTTAIVGVGIASTKVGSEFEAGMSQVAATMGFTQEQIRGGSKEFKMLEAAAREMGATTQFSATEASEALNYIALAGYDADDAIKLLPKTLNLAAAGSLELGYATDIVTDAMSALGLSIDDADSFIDQMARTSQKSNTDIGQLGEAILTVGGNAKDLAGGTVELNTALGILANNGLKGAEGGTKLRNVLDSLYASTGKARKSMDELGVSAYDAQGNMRPMNHVLSDVNEKLKDMTTEERRGWISKTFNKTDLAAVSALLASNATNLDDVAIALEAANGPGEEFRENINALAADFDQFADKQDFVNHVMENFGLTSEQAGTLYEGLKSAIEGTEWNQLEQNIRNSAGAAEEMSKIMIDNLKGDFTIMKSALQELGIAFYQTFQGNLRDSVQQATGYIDALSMAFRGLDISQIKSDLEDAGIAVDELGINLVQASFKMDQFATKAEFVDWAMSQFGLSSEQAGILFDTLADSMENSANRMELVGKVIGETVSSIIADIAGAAPEFMQLGIEIIQYLINGLNSNIGQISQSAAQIVTTLTQGILTLIPQFLALGGQLIVALIQGISQNASQLGSAFMESLSQIIQVIGTFIPQMITSGAEMILGLAQGIGEGIPDVMTSIIEAVANIGDAIITAIPIIVQAGAEIALGLAQGLAENLPLIIEEAPRLINEFANAIFGAIPQLIVVGVQIIVTIAKGLIQAIPTLIANIPAIIMAIINAFSLANLASVGVSLMESLGTGITSAKELVVEGVRNVMDNGVNIIKDFAETVWIHGSDLVAKLAQGISANTGNILTAATQLIGDFLTGLLSAAGNLLSAGIELVSNVVQGIMANPGQILTAAINLIQTLLSGIISAAGQLLSAGAELVGQLIAGIATHGPTLIGEGFKLIGQLLLGILQGIPTVLEVIPELIVAIVGALANLGGQLLEAGFNIVKSFASGLLGGKGEVEAAGQETGQAAAQGLNTDSEASEKGKLFSSSYSQGILGGLGDVSSAASQSKDSAVQGLEGAGEANSKGSTLGSNYAQGISGTNSEAGSAGSSLSDAAVSNLTTSAPKASSEGKTTGTKFATGVKGTQGESQSAGKEISNAAVEGAKASKGQMQSAGSEAGQAFADGFKSQVANIQSAVKSAMTGMQNAITSSKGQIDSALKNIITGMVNSINNSKSQFQNGGQQLMQSMQNGIQASQGQIVSAMRSVLSAATSAANSFRGQFVSIGRNISAGMASGIRSGSGAVAAAARSVAARAVAAAKSALAIHSPSKKMAEEVGLPSGQGIAAGLDESMPTIEESLNVIAEHMLKSMTDQHMNMALFERREVEERHQQMAKLGIYNINRMYEEFQRLHRDKIEQTQKEIQDIEVKLTEAKGKKLSEARKKELEESKKALEEKKKNLEDYSNAFDETYEKMVDSYQKAVDSIKSKSESLKDKLMSYGDVLEQVRDAEGKVVKNEFGEDVLKLTDLTPQIVQITNYGDLLEKLAARGADAEVMSQMMTMDIDKAVQYAKLLLNQTESDWDHYMNQMKMKRDMAEAIAKKYYDREMANIKEHYQEPLIKNLEEISETAGEVGEDSAKKMTEGFNNNKDGFIRSVRDVLNQMRQEMNQEINATVQEGQAQLSRLRADISAAQTAAANATINVYPQVAGGSPYQQGMQFGQGIERELRRSSL